MAFETLNIRYRDLPKVFGLQNFGVRNIERALDFSNSDLPEVSAELRRAAKRIASIRAQRERLRREEFAVARELLLGKTGDVFWRSEKHLALMRPNLRRGYIRWLISALAHARV